MAAARTPSEELTRAFYAWEHRGRGWAAWDAPVHLEPPFQPFSRHATKKAHSGGDDARRTGLLAKLGDFLRGATRSRSEDALESESSSPLSSTPEIFEYTGRLKTVELLVGDAAPVSAAGVRGLLLAWSAVTSPVAFELVGDSEALTVAVVCREHDEPIVRDQFLAYFPDGAIGDGCDLLSERWSKLNPAASVVVELGLAREFMIPILCAKSFEPDPLIPLAGALSDLDRSEVGVLQVIFEPVQAPWAESVLRAVTDGGGRPFFVDAPEITDCAREKVSHPLFAAAVRIGARAGSDDRCWEIVRALAGGLTQFGSPTSNEFIGLTANEHVDLTEDLLNRTSHRSGMLLSSEELMQLVHPPSGSLSSPKYRRQTLRSKAPPKVASGAGLLLGESIHRGVAIPIRLAPAERLRHVHVLGASGTGKSTLLLSMVLQDINDGRGAAVLDPHGDFVEDVLARIPSNRESDVVLVDPADNDMAVGFNVLSAHSELERVLLSSDLVAVFRRLSTSWGDQMTAVLGNAVEAFLASKSGGDLTELRRFLVERDYRESFLESVTDPDVVYYWRREFPLLVGKPQGPILTRLDAFLRPHVIRNMVTQRKNDLDLRLVVEEGKVLLVKLAQGLIGQENAALLGSLLVSKIQQVAMSRQDLGVHERQPYFLYIDEFHHFVTPSMALLLSGARKYALGLTLAHQDMKQLHARDPEVASAVLSNAGTRICFRVGDQDARSLEGGFASFSAKELQSLGIGQAICRIDRADADFVLRTLPVQSAPPEQARLIRERIRKQGITCDQIEPGTSDETPASAVLDQRLQSPAASSMEVAQLPPTRFTPSSKRTQPAQAGRGGAQHKYLQELVKRCAQAHGYVATVEEPILGGAGCVDIALRRGADLVACEIAVTSSPAQEVAHIQNCLSAGFGRVMVISLRKKTLTAIEQALEEAVGSGDRSRVQCVTPEEAMTYLEGSAGAEVESTVRGYRVRVSLADRSREDRARRARTVSEVIARTMRRFKGGEG